MHIDETETDAAWRHQALMALCHEHREALAGYPVASVLAMLDGARHEGPGASARLLPWAARLVARWAADVQQQLDDFPSPDTEALRGIRATLNDTRRALQALHDAMTAPARPTAPAPGPQALATAALRALQRPGVDVAGPTAGP